MENWKIYTKTGDKGETSLIGGKRVPKYHIRIEAYGTIDELKSYVGLLHDQGIAAQHQEVLREVMDRLFTAEAILARDEGPVKVSLPCLAEEDIEFLEKEIDRLNESLPALSSFILPCGHPWVSHAHMARCICRRAERIILKVAEDYKIPEEVIRYFNRLSDYLFVLSRSLAQDAGVGDTPWQSKPCR